MTTQQRLAQIIVPLVLALYALPVWIVSVDSWAGDFGRVDSTMTVWFLSLIAHPDSSLNLLHRVFLPISSFVTVAVLWNSGNRYWTIGVVVGVLLTIFLTVYLSVYFGMDNTQLNVIQTTDVADVQDRKTFFTLASSFLDRMQEVLATYLLTLLGIEVKK